MRADHIVIFLVHLEQVMKVPLAKHNNMIKAIPPDPLRTSIPPWRPCRNRPITDTHSSQPAENNLAIDAVAVTNDVARRPLPPVRLSQLVGNPFRGRMRRDTPHRSWRRPCCRINNPYNIRNEMVGTRNRSIDAMPS